MQSVIHRKRGFEGVGQFTEGGLQRGFTESIMNCGYRWYFFSLARRCRRICIGLELSVYLEQFRVCHNANIFAQLGLQSKAVINSFDL